jgi:hypothetical protein
MGAGVSQKVMNQHYYNRLKKIQRELEAAGVASKYASYNLSGSNAQGSFDIFFSTLRASNGETAGMLNVIVTEQAGKTDTYVFPKSLPEDGIKHIKEVFSSKQSKVFDVNGIARAATARDAKTTKSYHVTWEIDIDATSPKAAAKKALQYQRDPDSSATCFDVRGPDGIVIDVDFQDE